MNDILEENELTGANLPDEFKDFFSRISERIGSSSVITDTPRWICENTFLRGNAWSFKDHEFQIAIASDTNRTKYVKKCSQVGLSELSVRICLAIAAMGNGTTIIYVLPSAKFATKFSKSRFDPVIDGSPKLRRMIKSANDSAEMKVIGTSILHVNGAATKTQAISTPADVLIVDEYDFCNREVMTTFNSRLRHAEGGGHRSYFSTPTVENYGVSRGYDMSDQKRYMCRCEYCNEWQAPDFIQQVTIPGFDHTFDRFEKDDLVNPLYRWMDAYIRCVKCGKPLDRSLANPTNREWVAAHPNRTSSGYSIMPFDVIKYNPTHRVIEQLGEYELEQDYYNFVLGLTFASRENQIREQSVRENMVNDIVHGGEGYYIGIDVGKTCHVMVGKVKDGKRCVVNLMKVRSAEGDLAEQLSRIIIFYKARKVVIDAGPDFTLGQRLIQRFGNATVSQCVYVKPAKKNLSFFTIDEKTGLVAAARTRCFDAFVKAVNGGKWTYPKGDEMTKAISHLTDMKRINEKDAEGEDDPRWVKTTGMDHYFHANFYLHTAIELDDAEYNIVDVVGALPSITGVTVSKAATQASPFSQRLGDKPLLGPTSTLSTIKLLLGG